MANELGTTNIFINYQYPISYIWVEIKNASNLFSDGSKGRNYIFINIAIPREALAKIMKGNANPPIEYKNDPITGPIM